MTQVIIFDKDGTLFDFQATWGHWTGMVIDQLSGGAADMHAALCAALEYDNGARELRPGSVVIAGTPVEICDAIGQVMQTATPDGLLQVLVDMADQAPQVPIVPLGPVMQKLRDMGFKLAVMTNDVEQSAKVHLGAAQSLGLFDMVVGSDSGFGAKPTPDPLLAICTHLGCDPAASWMVGDSTHDMHAGQAAGMRTIGVLTGPASRAVLGPFATAVLDDISHIPAYFA